MALIKCPECGAEISSNAKQCVKCGCQITCCPECFSVYSGKVDVCTKCGYEITPQASANEITLEAQTKKFGRMIDSDLKTCKTVSIVAKIVDALTCALFLVGAWIFIAWVYKADMEKLESLINVHDNLKTITAIVIALFIVDVSTEKFAGWFLLERRNNWLREQKFDCKDYIKNYKVYGLQGDDADYYCDAIKNSFFMIENPKEKLWYVGVIVLRTVLFAISGICAGVWFTGNLKQYFAVKLISLQASYSWQFGAVFITAVVFLGLAIAVSFFADIPQTKRFKKWCNNL